MFLVTSSMGLLTNHIARLLPLCPREDRPVRTRNDAASNLGGSFPDDLSEVAGGRAEAGRVPVVLG